MYPNCHELTLQHTEEVLTQPTTLSTGERLVTDISHR